MVVPFFVAYDHPTKSVVISVRGTLSLPDIVTDGLVPTHEFDLPGFGEVQTHGGMLQSCRGILAKIHAANALAKAFDKHPDYRLVVVGHSLGAGVATLVACLLRQTYPELRCIAYSPPGCMLEAKPAAYAEAFITSVVVGHDFISRLSFNSLLRLRRDMIWALNNTRQPNDATAAMSAQTGGQTQAPDHQSKLTAIPTE
eukprot:m.159375 g.159375  ORF g.159375 m.159375 type:complete len:199 (+) comp17606_c0_seq23:4787-5383(+)